MNDAKARAKEGWNGPTHEVTARGRRRRTFRRVNPIHPHELRKGVLGMLFGGAVTFVTSLIFWIFAR